MDNFQKEKLFHEKLSEIERLHMISKVQVFFLDDSLLISDEMVSDDVKQEIFTLYNKIFKS